MRECQEAVNLSSMGGGVGVAGQSVESFRLRPRLAPAVPGESARSWRIRADSDPFFFKGLPPQRLVGSMVKLDLCSPPVGPPPSLAGDPS